MNIPDPTFDGKPLMLDGLPVYCDKTRTTTVEHRFRRSLVDRLFSGLTTLSWNPLRREDVVKVVVADPKIHRCGDAWFAHPETVHDLMLKIVSSYDYTDSEFSEE